MRFSCDRCGKGYATRDVPVPGRTYKLKCRACGNVMVMKGSAVSTADLARPSALTPLADLAAPPGQAPSGAAPENQTTPAALVPPEPPIATARARGVSPARTTPAAPAEPHYIELFDEGEFGDAPAAPASPPLPTDPAPVAAEPPSPSPALEPSPEELREAVESLGPSLSDPFAHVREELDAASAAKAEVPPVPPLVAEPRPTPAPQRLPAEPPRAALATPKRDGPPILAIVAAALLLLIGVGVVVWWTSRAVAPGNGRPTAAAPRTVPAPTPAPPAPAPDDAQSEAAPAGEAPSPEPQAATEAPQPPAPAASPPARTAEPAPEAAPPPPAPGPAAKPSPPLRPAPPRTADKQTRPPRPGERTDRKVARAEHREAAGPRTPAAPAPAASATAAPPAASAQPEPAAPAGLAQGDIQRVLGSSRKAFDACLRDWSRGIDDPGARQITLRFTVEPEGTVSYPTIDDVTISGAPVGQCLKAAARGMNFPVFRGDPVKVDAPIAIPPK